MVESDREGAFSVETWLSSGRGLTGFDTALEYALNPYNAVAVSATLNRLKDNGAKSYQREYDLAYQHNFVDTPREGYGLGFRISGAWTRANGTMHRDGWEVTLPFSWRHEPGGGTLVHVTPGYVSPHGASEYVSWALGVQQGLAPRDVVFAEAAGDRSNDDRMLFHGGWRHWLKRNKVAFDLTAGRVKGDIDSRNFVTAGVALFDLR